MRVNTMKGGSISGFPQRPEYRRYTHCYYLSHFSRESLNLATKFFNFARNIINASHIPNHSPHKFCYHTSTEKMFYSFRVITETATSIFPFPISSFQIVSSQNTVPENQPYKDFKFQRYPSLPQLSMRPGYLISF